MARTDMNLQPVKSGPNKFRFMCRECLKPHVSNGRTHADLDGPAFASYVCGECLSRLTLSTHAPTADLRCELAPWKDLMRYRQKRSHREIAPSVVPDIPLVGSVILVEEQYSKIDLGSHAARAKLEDINGSN